MAQLPSNGLEGRIGAGQTACSPVELSKAGELKMVRGSAEEDACSISSWLLRSPWW